MHECIHLSLQNGWTALRAASIAGNVQCLQILLDRCADVNMQDKVSGVIIYPVSMQCSTYPESPEVDDDVCAREPCLGRPLLFMLFDFC